MLNLPYQNKKEAQTYPRGKFHYSRHGDAFFERRVFKEYVGVANFAITRARPVLQMVAG